MEHIIIEPVDGAYREFFTRLFIKLNFAKKTVFHRKFDTVDVKFRTPCAYIRATCTGKKKSKGDSGGGGVHSSGTTRAPRKRR